MGIYDMIELIKNLHDHSNNNQEDQQKSGTFVTNFNENSSEAPHSSSEVETNGSN